MRKIFILIFLVISTSSYAKTRRVGHVSHHSTYHLKQRTSEFYINGSTEFFKDNSSISLGVGYTKNFKKISVSPSCSFSYDETSVFGSSLEFNFWQKNSPVSFGFAYQNGYDFVNKSNENWISFKPNYNFKINKKIYVFVYVSPNFKLDNKNGFEYSVGSGAGIDYIFSKKFAFELFVNNQSNFNNSFYPSFGMAMSYF